MNKLRSFDWYPKQTNAFELYTQCGNEWSKINTSDLTYKDWDKSWKDMPTEMVEYLQSLPEFNADLFKEIIGLDINIKVEELTMEEVCKELGRTVKIKE